MKNDRPAEPPLAELLRRRRSTLNMFIDEFHVATYADLVRLCAVMNVTAPPEPEFNSIVPPAEPAQTTVVNVDDLCAPIDWVKVIEDTISVPPALSASWSPEPSAIERPDLTEVPSQKKKQRRRGSTGE